MEGMEIAKLMMDSELKAALAKHARRYSSNVEDQEEFIDDAWIRIAEKREGMTMEYYEDEGRKAIQAAYMRNHYRVYINSTENVNGISERPAQIPKNAIPLGNGRYLCPEPEKLDSWYYEGEWLDYGLEKDCTVRRFYRIAVCT